MRRIMTALFLWIIAFIFMNQNSAAEVTVEEVKQAVLKELRGNQSANPDSNVFNPAMGVVIDSVFSHSSLDQADFNFRSAEINLQASVDPSLKAYAIINGTSDGVEVEEAAVVTSRLVRGLQLRGGRYFANFGRLPKFHDHELPFVNRTTSLDRFFNGETQAQGVEATYLLPTPFFLQATLGATNKIGAESTRLEFDPAVNAANTTVSGDTHGRRLSSFTYNARLFTYVPIGDNHGIDLGVSEAMTPKPRYFQGAYINNVSHAERRLSGIDITYRYEPREENVYRKLIWGTEIFHNTELFRSATPDLDLDGDSTAESFSAQSLTRKYAWGGYSFIEATIWRRLSMGGFYDVSQKLDDRSYKTRTVGVTTNFLISEFQKIRLQLSKVTDNQGGPQDKQLFVQWFATIGKHAHTFKDR